jgi:hypothetical protein
MDVQPNEKYARLFYGLLLCLDGVLTLSILALRGGSPRNHVHKETALRLVGALREEAFRCQTS